MLTFYMYFKAAAAGAGGGSRGQRGQEDLFKSMCVTHSFGVMSRSPVYCLEKEIF